MSPPPRPGGPHDTPRHGGGAEKDSPREEALGLAPLREMGAEDLGAEGSSKRGRGGQGGSRGVRGVPSRYLPTRRQSRYPAAPSSPSPSSVPKTMPAMAPPLRPVGRRRGTPKRGAPAEREQGHPPHRGPSASGRTAAPAPIAPGPHSPSSCSSSTVASAARPRMGLVARQRYSPAWPGSPKSRRRWLPVARLALPRAQAKRGEGTAAAVQRRSRWEPNGNRRGPGGVTVTPSGPSAGGGLRGRGGGGGEMGGTGMGMA